MLGKSADVFELTDEPLPALLVMADVLTGNRFDHNRFRGFSEPQVAPCFLLLPLPSPCQLL